ncbi:hypothetical protein AYO40_01490 [Planctomycetaceae bacterium SCGC AG-212-D15]|nr:hypothetical protein AYO40_01490 [Planctomycetaceae bacterium SCGC AG-212-D15]
MDDIFKRAPIASAPLSIILTVAGATGWEDTLGDWVGYLNGLDREYELLLVSERPDVTVDAAAGRYTRAKAMPAPDHPGFGAALARGIAAAQMPLLFYGRCEPAYKPPEIQKLLKHIDPRDLVVGRRSLPAGVPPPRGRLTQRLLARLLFGIRLADVGCPFLLARRHIFARIPIQSHGLFAHAEVIAKANFLGCLMMDTPIAYQPASPPPRDPTLKEVWPDLRRVFFHPDFGPADVRLVLTDGGVPAKSEVKIPDGERGT